jgi:hypothetical protein
MYTAQATDRKRSDRRLVKRLAAPLAARALAMAISGPVGAIPLRREFPVDGPIPVTLTVPGRIDEAAWLAAKLRTTAGRQVLVDG